MSRSACALAAATVVTLSALYAYVTGQELFGAACALLALGALIVPARSTLPLPTQALLLVGCGVVSFLWHTQLVPTDTDIERQLGKLAPVLGGGALLLCALRTYIANPEWGLRGTLLLGMLVLIGCGRVRSGLVFPLGMVAFGLLAFAALRADDAVRSAWRELSWRHHAALASVLAVGGALSLAMILALPRLDARISVWAMRWIAARARVGFHDGAVGLGSLEGLLESDDVVMRIEGPAGPPLRGNVYSRYGGARWLPRRGPELEIRAELPLADGPSITRIHFASRRLDRFFLPRGIDELQLEPPLAEVDASGIVRTRPGEAPEVAHLRAGPQPRFELAAPDAEDLQLPEALVPELTALAREWTAGASGAEAKIGALRERLERGYAYSLTSHHGDAAVDPILHFLTREPQGHCEYFASALVLLARAAGVPARFVTGYRVSERNPWSDYAIVRERHAHAWAEVHVPGAGWIDVDPSPLRSLEAQAPPTGRFTALLDLAIFSWRLHGPLYAIVALLLTFVGIQLQRLARARSGSRGAGRARPNEPPEFLSALLQRLQRELDLRRAPAEPLEAFARRLAPSTAQNSPEARARIDGAAALLLRCAALRYGGIGSSDALRADVDGWLAGTGTRREAPSAAPGA